MAAPHRSAAQTNSSARASTKGQPPPPTQAIVQKQQQEIQYWHTQFERAANENAQLKAQLANATRVATLAHLNNKVAPQLMLTLADTIAHFTGSPPTDDDDDDKTEERQPTHAVSSSSTTTSGKRKKGKSNTTTTAKKGKKQATKQTIMHQIHTDLAARLKREDKNITGVDLIMRETDGEVIRVFTAFKLEQLTDAAKKGIARFLLQHVAAQDEQQSDAAERQDQTDSATQPLSAADDVDVVLAQRSSSTTTMTTNNVNDTDNNDISWCLDALDHEMQDDAANDTSRNASSVGGCVKAAELTEDQMYNVRSRDQLEAVVTILEHTLLESRYNGSFFLYIARASGFRDIVERWAVLFIDGAIFHSLYKLLGQLGETVTDAKQIPDFALRRSMAAVVSDRLNSLVKESGILSTST